MNNLDKILDEYHNYLMDRKLAKKEHTPYLVRWVKEFLRFARNKTGHKFETVDSPRKNTSCHDVAQRRRKNTKKGNHGLFVPEIKKFVL